MGAMISQAVSSDTCATTVLRTFLYAFTGGAEGAFPAGGLITDVGGALYGVASQGGAYGRGVAFKLTPPPPGEMRWTQSVLHSFRGGVLGEHPNARLVMDAKGAVYGTARGGRSGKGVIFRLRPPAAGETQWTESVLYTFTGGVDGEDPENELVCDSYGALYGTSRGRIFKLTPPASGIGSWNLAVIGGGSPVAALIFDPSGALYGIDSGSQWQQVFKLSRPAPGQTAWTRTNIFEMFTSGGTVDMVSGKFNGLVSDSNGDLYVTVVDYFEPYATKLESFVHKLRRGVTGYHPEDRFHTFTGGDDGVYPSGALIRDTSSIF